MARIPVVAAASGKRILQVKVKPNARTTALTEAGDGTWIAQIAAPPVDGKANAALIALIAEHFSCRKAAVTIASGAGARLKLVRITGD